MKWVHISWIVAALIGFSSSILASKFGYLGWLLILGWLIGSVIQFKVQDENVHELFKKWDNDLKYGGYQ